MGLDHLPGPGGTWICGCPTERHASAGEADYCRLSEFRRPPPPVNDPVNHPKHYNSHPSGVEAIEICEHFTFNLGNATKYIWRHGLKPTASAVEDLKKARWYLDREIAMLEEPKLTAEKLAADEPSKPMCFRWESASTQGVGGSGTTAEFIEAETMAKSPGAINAKVYRLAGRGAPYELIDEWRRVSPLREWHRVGPNG